MKAERLCFACAATLALMACDGGTELATVLSSEDVRPRELTTALSGAAEKPNPVQTPGTGTAQAWVEGSKLIVEGRFRDLTANASAAHIHGPGDENSTSPVFCNLRVPAATSGAISVGTGGDSCGALELTSAEAELFETGKMYVNIHSTTYPGGELRGQLQPRARSEGTGTVLFTVEDEKLTVFGSFQDLESNAVSAQIRGPADTNSTGPVFCNLQVPASRSGSIDAGQGADSCGDRVLSPTELEHFKSGRMYVSLHTETRPNGELRGKIFEGNLDD
ncbi:MAG TPA: CHRD domain-containing protein [Myxococcaceae bacterium]